MKHTVTRRLALLAAAPVLGLALAGCDTMGVANSVIGGAAQNAVGGATPASVPSGRTVPAGSTDQVAREAAGNILNSVLNAPK